jgi:hypothetical protein
MPKIKNKPVDLWPKWESPERLSYPDLYPLPQGVYEEASRGFTPDNLEAVENALAPINPGFDLLGRLRRAVYHYFWLRAGAKGDLEFSRLLSPAQQKEELKEIAAAAATMLRLCERREGTFHRLLVERDTIDEITESIALIDQFKSVLKRIHTRASDNRSRLRTKRGNRDDIARRAFCYYLFSIFESATGKHATTTKNGLAHNFFSVCWSDLIDSEISDESTLNYLKDTIAVRDQIKVSPLFQ